MERDALSLHTVPPTSKELEGIRTRINEEVFMKQNSRIISGTKRKEYPNDYRGNAAKRYRQYDEDDSGVELDPEPAAGEVYRILH
ncbi:hypothetical protein AYI68_g6040 [Smittium mucronatum]|uniref:Uncharacterized protein n=1 Tax=Smittium mucronatum TaxID=133383 RepID=A0A1R0GSR7_9FUNG|nr:hypothetical protein AYI68_g6040 [Smittium mucronatum]